MSEKLVECPLCHTKVPTLFKIDLEEWSQGYEKGILLVCELCLKREDLGTLLSDISYHAMTLKDEDLEAVDAKVQRIIESGGERVYYVAIRRAVPHVHAGGSGNRER